MAHRPITILLHAAILATFVVNAACQAHPQGSVLSGLDRNAVGTTIHLTPMAWSDPTLSVRVRAVVGSFPTLVTAVATKSQGGRGDGGLVAGIGLSPALWAHWGTFLPAPAGILAFPGYEGVGGWPRMPATDGDLFVHAKAARRDVLYALVDLLVQQLGEDAIDSVETVNAWTNALDGQNRDLTGFVDGTVNAPSAQKAAAGLISAALDPAHANGSYAIAQVWRHDLAAFHRLNQSTQEAVFGRTKVQSAPLPHQASSSHVARVRQSALATLSCARPCRGATRPARRASCLSPMRATRTALTPCAGRWWAAVPASWAHLTACPTRSCAFPYPLQATIGTFRRSRCSPDSPSIVPCCRNSCTPPSLCMCCLRLPSASPTLRTFFVHQQKKRKSIQKRGEKT
ncbi:dyp-type peroxidase [Pandoravirus inopinatum]|uniref:Dyp-type peroxidase n=1 Tax=Pandoravirus inopinatum TaxID=1605721 RepID=A0A0B5JDC7_9VIRU|nr:dyp-type peroxidase [Pandoravirus inopinatum]AJF97672.1 dyp-type peroxidase [Pandoravirus inopinatum]